MQKKRFVAAAIAGLLVLTACGNPAQQAEDTPAQQEDTASSTPVEVQSVVRTNLSNESMVSGQVVADAPISIVPTISGTVLNLPVKVGDSVKKGDLLFRIDTTQITSSYSALKQSYDATQRMTNEAIQNAQAALPIAQSALTTAQTNYDNTLALFNVGAVSQVEVDQTRIQLEQARNQLSQAQSAVTQARASQQAQLAQIEASLSQMHAQVAAATVTAPCDGLIVGVNITAGGIAAPSGPAILLSEGGRTRVSVQVSEDLLGQLKVGDIAEVTVSAVSDVPFQASIASIAPAANAQTALYEVRMYTLLGVHYPIGAFAEVTFFTNQRKDTVTIPSDAILTDGTQSYVYIVEEEAATKVPVDTGIVGNGITEILSGLTGGEMLVIKGQNYLTDGTAVRIVADKTDKTQENEQVTDVPLPQPMPQKLPESEPKPEPAPEAPAAPAAAPAPAAQPAAPAAPTPAAQPAPEAAPTPAASSAAQPEEANP